MPRPNGLRRARLRRAALRFATHGWDVVPGACLTRGRFHCGKPKCRTVACHPAIDAWETAASHDPATVAAWWRHLPHSILLVTGRAFDVIEVPAAMGRPALANGTVRGPVAVALYGRWMFLVRPGHGLLPELARRPDVVLHGPGSWVPAPPNPQVGGRVRWRVAPQTLDWRLPDAYAVQALLRDTLSPTGRVSSSSGPLPPPPMWPPVSPAMVQAA